MLFLGDHVTQLLNGRCPLSVAGVQQQYYRRVGGAVGCQRGKEVHTDTG